MTYPPRRFGATLVPLLIIAMLWTALGARAAAQGTERPTARTPGDPNAAEQFGDVIGLIGYALSGPRPPPSAGLELRVGAAGCHGLGLTLAVRGL